MTLTRSLVYDGPGVLSIAEHESADVPADRVVVRPVAVGICGSDVHGYLGETGRRHRGQVMGHEVVGVVEELGSAVADPSLAPGTPVAINPVVGCGRCTACCADRASFCEDSRVIGVDVELPGGLADRMLVPAANVVPLASADPACVVIEPMAVGLQAVRRSGVRPGDGVVVIGAGMVGLAAASWAVRDGAASVVVADISEAKAASAARVGGLGVVTGAGRSLADAVRSVTAASVGHVIDAVGVSATVASAIDLVERGGTVCLVGMGSPALELADFSLITRQVSLVGTWCYTADHFREAARVVSAEPDRFRWLLDSETPLEETPALFARLAGGYSPEFKVVVRPGWAPWDSNPRPASVG